jgi:pimeloyl-ACP methyl ester carboxylesterase
VPRFIAGLVALLLVVVAPPFAAESHAVTGPDGVGTIPWRSCGRQFECGSISVPVDYVQPSEGRTRIAVARARALDSGHRVGSLVLNFGGPGDPGTETLRSFIGSVPMEIRRRYDLVGFDPRGVGKSNAIDCISDAAADEVFAVDPTPDTETDLRAFYDGNVGGVDFVQSCIDHHGSWLARVGSRNVARDLDLLRAALGDDRLTYLGFSYGTVIGAVYAQEFRERVGRMVLDGPVDLTLGLDGENADEAAGFEHALDAFLRDCARRESCRFRSGGHPRAALAALRNQFEHGLTLRNGDDRRDRRRAGVAAFYTALVAGLYDKKFGWSDLAWALSLARHRNGSGLLALADGYNGRRGDGTYDDLAESSGIILCADQPQPLEPFDRFVAEYERATTEHPFFGGFVSDVPVGCDPRLPRPSPSDALGDVRVTGAAPILIVGTTDDPATPYSGARDLSGRIGNSRLLTFVSTEHTAYTKSRCIDRAVDRYLLGGALPRVGTRCRP